ncbi:DnaJ domain [uncultured Caudovirales phage]|uniref:DnaJ domain n=1 Tax=uncultured Caudovirales phage TaxID=2100421 RepID=A0A6J7WLQ5_9CAUD|nr:DnaJ domain [uncultured Caudovirales phage]CAB5219019.1 DnaJ domain [uncultured Caudovirales phage]
MSHYKVLGVSHTATKAEIGKAYRSMVRQYHPDAPGGGNVDKMSEVNAAYGVLNHPEKRASYDKEIGVGSKPAAASTTPSGPPPKPSAKPQGAKPAAAPTAKPTTRPSSPRPTTRPTTPSRPAVTGGRTGGGPVVRRPEAGPVVRADGRPVVQPNGPVRAQEPPTAPPAAPTPSAPPSRPAAPAARPSRFGGGISGLHTAQFGHLRSANANGGVRQPWLRPSTPAEREGGAGRVTVTPLFKLFNDQNPQVFGDVSANPGRYAAARLTPMERDAIKQKREAADAAAAKKAEDKAKREEARATADSEREGKRQTRHSFRVNSQMQKERMRRTRRWLNSSEAGARSYSADTRHVDPVQPSYDSPPALTAGRESGHPYTRGWGRAL